MTILLAKTVAQLVVWWANVLDRVFNLCVVKVRNPTFFYISHY